MDALQAEILVRNAGSRRRTRRALATIMVAVAFLGSALYWLAITGTISPSISPPSGTANGAVAEVFPMSDSVTRSVGAATLQTGVALSRLEVAKDSTDKIRVNVVWTNPNDAQQVLNNPNAQIAIGLYYPVHTGTCSGSESNGGAVLVTDGGTDYCSKRASGTPKPPFTDSRLLLARNIHTGYVRPSQTESSDVTPCPANTGSTWCRPGTVGDSNQRTYYVVAQILTPGGNPQGQQNIANDILDFYVTVKRIG